MEAVFTTRIFFPLKEAKSIVSPSSPSTLNWCIEHVTSVTLLFEKGEINDAIVKKVAPKINLYIEYILRHKVTNMKSIRKLKLIFRNNQGRVCHLPWACHPNLW